MNICCNRPPTDYILGCRHIVHCLFFVQLLLLIYLHWQIATMTSLGPICWTTQTVVPLNRASRVLSYFACRHSLQQPPAFRHHPRSAALPQCPFCSPFVPFYFAFQAHPLDLLPLIPATTPLSSLSPASLLAVPGNVFSCLCPPSSICCRPRYRVV